MLGMLASLCIVLVFIVFVFFVFVFFFFFFSSRRRHTRWNCDWSSDVCSSDLFSAFPCSPPICCWRRSRLPDCRCLRSRRGQIGKRRVGKECRSRWSPYH